MPSMFISKDCLGTNSIHFSNRLANLQMNGATDLQTATHHPSRPIHLTNLVDNTTQMSFEIPNRDAHPTATFAGWTTLK